MKPPILQTDWLNRVGFAPNGRTDHLETFVLHAVDTRHPRALTVRLHLVGRGRDRYGEVQVTYRGEDGARSGSERWPVNRIQIDPERAGVGIGESCVQEGVSSGLVRGSDFAVSWNLVMHDELPGMAELPAPWLYRSGRASPLITTPHPAGIIQRGKVELWQGLSRHVPVRTIDLSGWRVVQSHRWGPNLPERFACLHCNTFEEVPRGAAFSAFTGPVSVGPLTPTALLGRLVLGGQTYRFDSWRNLFGAPSRFSATEWLFELQGPDGRLNATLRARPDETVVADVPTLRAGRSHAFTSCLATLTLALTPSSQGGTRSLTSQRALFEVVQPEPRGAQAVAA